MLGFKTKLEFPLLHLFNTIFYIFSYSFIKTLQPLKFPKYDNVDFSPLSRVGDPCARVSEIWREEAVLQQLVGLKNRKSIVGGPFFIPSAPGGACGNVQEVIKSQQYHLTSRLRQRGECLRSPWCPLTPRPGPSGSAGHAPHSRSAPALHRTW